MYFGPCKCQKLWGTLVPTYGCDELDTVLSPITSHRGTRVQLTLSEKKREKERAKKMEWECENGTQEKIIIFDGTRDLHKKQTTHFFFREPRKNLHHKIGPQ